MSNRFVRENVKNFLNNDDYCRLCLNKNTNLISVFDKGNNIHTFIHKMYYIKIKKSDRLSKYICQECIDVCIDFLRRRFRYNNNNSFLKKVEVRHSPGSRRSYIKKQTLRETKNAHLQKECHQSVVDICSKHKILIPEEYWNCDFNPYINCDDTYRGMSWPREKNFIQKKLKSCKNEDIQNEIIKYIKKIKKEENSKNDENAKEEENSKNDVKNKDNAKDDGSAEKEENNKNDEKKKDNVKNDNAKEENGKNEEKKKENVKNDANAKKEENSKNDVNKKECGKNNEKKKENTKKVGNVKKKENINNDKKKEEDAKNKENEDYTLDSESNISPIQFQSLGVASCIKMYRRSCKKPDRYGCSITSAKNDTHNLNTFLKNNIGRPILGNETTHNEQISRQSRTKDREPNKSRYKKVRSKSESHLVKFKSNDDDKIKKEYRIKKKLMTCSEDRWNSFFEKYYTDNQQQINETSEPTEKTSNLKNRRKSLDSINYKFQKNEPNAIISRPIREKFYKTKGKRKSWSDGIDCESERNTIESEPITENLNKSKKRRKSKINHKSQKTNSQKKTKLKKKYLKKQKINDSKKIKKNEIIIQKRKYVRRQKNGDEEFDPKRMYYKQKCKKKGRKRIKVKNNIQINNTIELNSINTQNQIDQMDVCNTSEINYKIETSESINDYTLNNDYLIQTSEPAIARNLKMEPIENELLEQIPPPELLLEQTAKRIFICTFCDKIFSNEKELRLHEALHANNYFLPCPQFKFDYSMEF